MFVEKRKLGKSIKYYLAYSYRKNKDVKKIRRYLGTNLSKEQLNEAKNTHQKEINKELEQLNTEVFNFSLSKTQIRLLNNYNKKINIHHLQGWNWQIFTEQFTYNTNAIEGSTVNQEEVHEILQQDQFLGEEEIETGEVASAVELIRTTKKDLSLEFLKELHHLCFRNSKPFAGKFRNVEVVIRGREGIVHSGVPVAHLHYALNELVDWYKHNKNKFKPLVLAAIMHNQFEHIHPFQDGNGRVGRLLLNFILIKNKHPPINILLEDRQEYYMTLQEYSKHQDLKPTLKFLISQYKKTLKQVTTKHNRK